MSTPYSTISLTAACSFLLLLLWGSAAQQHAVLDTDGDELVVGRGYFISSIWRGDAGGYLSLRPGSCPQPVIQTSSDSVPGLPALFWPASGARGRPVNVSANLDIQFIINPDTWVQCDANPVWKVGIVSFSNGIGTGGEPGPNKDREYRFRIEPYESNYKLSHCWLCESCEDKMSCRDLTIWQDPFGRRLVVEIPGIDTVFEVVFMKGGWGNEGARTIKRSTDN